MLWVKCFHIWSYLWIVWLTSENPKKVKQEFLVARKTIGRRSEAWKTFKGTLGLSSNLILHVKVKK